MKFRQVSTALSRCDNPTVGTGRSTQNARIFTKQAVPVFSDPGFCRLLTTGVFTLAVALSNAAAQRGPAPVPVPTMISDDTQMISFLCGCILSPEEKQRIARFAQAEVSRVPEVWYRNDVSIRQDLNEIREKRGVVGAEKWEGWRLSLALGSPGDVETQILEAHDRTVVLDREHQLVITERSLQNLYSAAAWVAQQSGAPSPGADYVGRVRNVIKQQYASWPADVRASYAHVFRNLEGTKEYLPVVAANLRDNLFAAWRRKNFTAPENSTLLVNDLSIIYKLDIQERQRLLMEAQNGAIHAAVKADPTNRH
jgi:hypothetical protein